MNTNITNSVDHADHADHGHHDVKPYGFWVYLMSDLVIFSLLFATYAVLGGNFAGGPGPKELFHLPFVFVETMLLLFSSVSYGMGMIALQNNNLPKVKISILITALLGLGFIGMEIYEFYELIIEGFGPDRSAFLSSFFTLVGTHGLHVFFGLIWMFMMIYQLFTQGITEGVRSRLGLLGLFWHFLDIVWIGVFTVVYLLGVL